MGLFKSKDKLDAGEDPNKRTLFGSRSKSNLKSSSPAPGGNPYATPQAAPGANPYAKPDPYLDAKKRAYGSGPPADTNSRGGHPDDKKSPYGNGYGVQDRGQDSGAGGYGANQYGGQSGYGGDRYSGNSQQPAQQQPGSRYGPGGYGGMGAARDPYSGGEDDDSNRGALFGGAAQRQKQRQQQPSDAPPPYGADDGSGSASNPYGDYNAGPAYQDRQLTAEEEEEQEVLAGKNEIRQIKQQDVSSTRNALRIANRAEEVGRDTLARLGAQGEAIHNTDRSLDLAHNQNKIAEDKARELKTLNRSMFAVHTGNPFTSKSRLARADQAVIDRHTEERDQRESTRRAAYLTDQRMQQNFKGLEASAEAHKKRERNLAERAKYQFEADSEDEGMENEIDDNLDALSGVTGRLNALARATGQEVESQNKKLDEIANKVCLVFPADTRAELTFRCRAIESTLGWRPTMRGSTGFAEDGSPIGPLDLRPSESHA